MHSTGQTPQPVSDTEPFSTSLTIGIQTESAGLTYDKLLLCGLYLHGEGLTLEELKAVAGSHALLRRPLPLMGSLSDPRGRYGVDGDEKWLDRNLALEDAISQLLAAWPDIMPGTTPPPLKRWRRATSFLALGHQEALYAFEEHMFNASVPRWLRQELWLRRSTGLVYKMLGRCGFLTRCFPRKFWLPKHTSRQQCWHGQDSGRPSR